MSQAVPAFYLYGEPPRDVEHHFLHLEDLADRSRPADWNIRPHAHANLNHVFLLTGGEGRLTAEEQTIAFSAPCLMLIPAGVVHAFRYVPESAGKVLTIAEEFLRELLLREPAFGGLFENARAVRLGPEAAAICASTFAALAQELSWRAAARGAAIEAQLLVLLVLALRAAERAGESGRPTPGPRALLVARFRALLERRFREPLKLDAYCAELGCTTSQLRSACLATVGKAPLRLIQDRLMLEAKRGLLYSNMTVAEIAYDLGFEDPAYFSRFFSSKAGRSPRSFRAS